LDDSKMVEEAAMLNERGRKAKVYRRLTRMRGSEWQKL